MNNEIKPVENHKREKNTAKSAIKKFNLDYNNMTGIANFSEICKDPLRIPQHGLDIAKAQSSESN